MRASEIVATSMAALGRNRLRSFLTTLGIIIGVFAVVTIVAVGEGAQKQVADQIRALGANRIMITPSSRQFSGAQDRTNNNTLSVEDSKALEKECPDIAFVSPTANSSAPIVYRNQNWQTSVQGVGIHFPDIREWPADRGSYFTESDVQRATKVCVIGKTVATQLFGDDDPVGKIIRVKNIPFRVLGVLTEKGQAAWGQDQDDVILAPYTTVMKKIKGSTWLNMIQISAHDEKAVDSAEQQLTETLHRRHHIQPGEPEDFQIRSQKDIQQTMDRTYGTIVAFLICVASIALLVGGIGIMNIMLVSVTERIREIGIRMAVGAKSRDILWQFLLEAVLLALLGGLLGIAAGVVTAQAIGRTLRWSIVVNPKASIVAFSVSAIVGIVFGFYPAWSASKLDPITALRND